MIEKIDFEYMKKLYESAKNGVTFDTTEKEITPITAYDKSKIDNSELTRLNEMGVELIKSGKLAICSMAGGQGTRLGFDGPKGTFMLNINDKSISIFETTVNKLKDAYEKYGVLVYWYIMTSRQNNDVTVKFFEDNIRVERNKNGNITINFGAMSREVLDGVLSEDLVFEWMLYSDNKGRGLMGIADYKGIYLDDDINFRRGGSQVYEFARFQRKCYRHFREKTQHQKDEMQDAFRRVFEPPAP